MEENKILKHLKWNIKSRVLDYMEERGASFTEDKYLKPLVNDIKEYYIEHKDDDQTLDDIVKDITDYYLEEMFGTKHQEDEMIEEDENKQPEGAVVNEVDKGTSKEDLAGIMQGDKNHDEDENMVGKVTCLICGGRYKVLYPHLLAKHHMTPENYRIMFPKGLLRSGVPEKEHKGTEKALHSGARTIRERIIRLATTIKQIETR